MNPHFMFVTIMLAGFAGYFIPYFAFKHSQKLGMIVVITSMVIFFLSFAFMWAHESIMLIWFYAYPFNFGLAMDGLFNRRIGAKR